MDIVDFSNQNIWWRGKSYIGEDRHIRNYFSKKYKWEPFDTLSYGELVPGNIFTLRGPRQIGKTTHIKLMIKALIEEKSINEQTIFYFSCDMISDNKELVRVIQRYLDSYGVEGSCSYIFLDEVSNVRDWQKAVKYLVDVGALDNICLVLTGSHTLDIKYGFERLPGRVGRLGKNYMLLPLKFSEFVMLIRPDIAKKLSKIHSFSELANASKSAFLYNNILKKLFDQYLVVGGFPLVINEYFTEKVIPDYIFELYTQWVIGDIVKWGKQERIAKQVIRTALNKQSTSLSWDSFSKDAEIKSHKTVSAYVEDLENMFVLFVLYFINLDKKVVNYSKNKKLYFFDPFIYHMFDRMFYFRQFEIVPSLIESVAVMHFSRFAQKLVSGSELSDVAFYFKNKRETDIVLKIKDELIGVEVKYQNDIKSDDFASLYHFKFGIMVSKSVFDVSGKYPVIPIHIILSVLDC